MSCRLVSICNWSWCLPCANTVTALFAKVQSFLVLLNRQRDERTTRSASSTSPPSYPNTLPGINSATYTPSGTGGGDGLHQAPIRGRPLVINSSVQLLQTFLFFAHRHPAVLICWTIGQQAFNAAMIIILDACETENDQNIWLVDQAYKVFDQLDKDGVHKLAKLAVERISRGIILVENRQRERRDEANAAAAAAHAAGMSRRPSQQQQQQQQQQYQTQAPYQYSPHMPPYHLYQPILSIDNADLASTDFSGDTIMANTVMGETGMFLLEDSGLQSHNPATQHFQPWSLSLPSSAAASSPHSSATSPPAFAVTGQYSPSAPPMVPVSNVPIAPFPVISQQFQVPMLASPFAVGLQPRMPVGSGRGQQGQQPGGSGQDAGAVMQHHARPQSMEGQQHQHASRTGYSPYQTQATRHSGTSRSHGHRSERPTSGRSRSGRAR
jgi:hypothetical protein